MTPPSTSTARTMPTLLMWLIACQAGCVIGAIIAASLGVRILWPIWLTLICNCFGIASNFLPPTRSGEKHYLAIGFVLISIVAVVGSVLTGT